MYNDTVDKVFVIGAGIRGKKQLTLEAIARLRNVGNVLFFPCESITYDWLVNDLCLTRVESLEKQYQDKGIDQENYSRITNRVLQSCHEFNEIAVLVPGHPRVGVSWIHNLEKAHIKGEINLKIIDGISSIDTMISDLGRDPLEHGSIIIDANRMLLYRLKIDPRIDHYVYHVCSVGTTQTNMSNPSFQNKLDLLKNILLEYFPKDHQVKFVQSGTVTMEGASILTFPLEKLDEMVYHVTFGTTLYIPGLSFSKKDIDPDFLSILYSKQ